MADFHRISPSLLCVSTVLLLAGCARMQTASVPGATPGVKLTGTVFGGQQPVTGSHIYLYAASSSAYGGVSTSLLSMTASGATVDSSGNAYVTTDAGGSFTITGDYTCPSANTETYILALQGNPGLSSGTNNTALALMAGLGPCGSLSPATVIIINEVSTVAAATVLQQFMTDEFHVGTSSTNAAGLANAFTTILNIADLFDGGARTVTLLGNGVAPQAKLNTLADILAPCVNSAGPTSTACSSLFTDTAPASDTIQAALAIAKSPGILVSNLFFQITPTPPFLPTLTSTPNDFTLSITYTGGGLTSPGDVVIDAAGDAFTANCPSCDSITGTDSIVGFGPQGAILTGAAGFSTGIHAPQGIALDTAGNIWSANDATSTNVDSIVKMTSAGTVVTGFPYTSSNDLATPLDIAIDASSNAWITNETARPGASSSNVIELNPSGSVTNTVGSTALLGSTGIGIDPNANIFVSGYVENDIYKFHYSPTFTGTEYTGAGLSAPISIAIDGADNVWTLNDNANTLSVVNGSTGAAVTSSVGVNTAQAAVIAIDGAGTGWVANCRASCPGSGSSYVDNLLHFSIGGVALTGGADGYQDSHLSAAGVAAIDGSGNVWVSNNTGGSLTEFLGVAAPVKTPLAAAVSGNQLGARP